MPVHGRRDRVTDAVDFMWIFPEFDDHARSRAKRSSVTIFLVNFNTVTIGDGCMLTTSNVS